MENNFITFSEAGKLLRLSRQTIHRLIARREIPSYKIGGRRLFDREELVEWVKSQKDHGPPGKSKRSKPKESHPGPSSSPKSGQKSEKKRS